MRTKVRIIAMFTSTARSLVRTEESMAISCSVKASGLDPPRLRREGITFCDSKISTSSSSSSNRKSEGKRFGLRRTCCRSAMGLTW